MKLALAQVNPTVGDFSRNEEKILDFIKKAKAEGADLVIFPELAVSGYPPEDLILKPQFISDNILSVKRIIKECDGIGCFLGFIDRKGKDLFNAGAFIVNKKIRAVYHKINLPNYGVFDEKRYFKEGKKCSTVDFHGIKIGLGICEDIWVDKGPYYEEAKSGAKLILNINASPYHAQKIKERVKLLRLRAVQTKAHVAYVNMVGGQDELIFDGGSMACDAKGRLAARAKQFKEDLLITDFGKRGRIEPLFDELPEIYEALLLSIRDYVGKNKFSDVLVGLSGGIDSALTLALASDALGASHARAVFMPSSYTSKQSFLDSEKLADNLGVKLTTFPIEDIFSMYIGKLSAHFEGKAVDITEENIQARIRGTILMAFSNKFGFLVLTTGNKSETSTGYCTLYGDMAGGFNVLKDIPKTLVYELANWRNRDGIIIPEDIISRVPTAELKPNQTDQDTLPPYETLDPIMKAYVEEDKSLRQIVKMGYPESIVKKIISMIDMAEYKRRQAPPGPRISSRAFGKDWRVPITNG